MGSSRTDRKLVSGSSNKAVPPRPHAGASLPAVLLGYTHWIVQQADIIEATEFRTSACVTALGFGENSGLDSGLIDRRSELFAKQR